MRSYATTRSIYTYGTSNAPWVTTKVGKRLGLLCRTRNDLTANAANMIYKTFILPIFDYCDSVWVCFNRGDIDQLEHLQNRAARTGYEKHSYGSSPGSSQMGQT